jgi:hypothetical protein
MAQTTVTVELGRVEKMLSSWRERCGGRGRPIPEELWRAAAEVATVAGVKQTARVLGVDRERLLRRVGSRVSGASGAAVLAGPAVASAAFVEVDARGELSRGKTVVRLSRRDGEQLEIEVEGCALDVAAALREFWERAR